MYKRKFTRDEVFQALIKEQKHIKLTKREKFIRKIDCMNGRYDFKEPTYITLNRWFLKKGDK